MMMMMMIHDDDDAHVVAKVRNIICNIIGNILGMQKGRCGVWFSKR